MESLSETPWDVVISGTGLQQSLLALALSRSDKKVLHVDRNEYYGGAEAAFSLQEVDQWVEQVNGDSLPTFRNASLSRSETDAGKLSFSRAYSLTLSPQIIYTKSKLLAQLVASKVYRQLEFQAVGNWWVYQVPGDGVATGSLQRLPSGREDIFTDVTIDNRSKRSLMKFLKFVVDYENQTEIWESHADEGLSQFLASQFKLPEPQQMAIFALTLSLDPPEKTSVAYALPRIARHLTSIGVFGPGFGAVVPKWGGGAEIAQVACRAGAVGGGVYVLGTGLKDVNVRDEDSGIECVLSNGETVKTKSLLRTANPGESTPGAVVVSKTVSIVSSQFASIFTTTVEGAPTAAVSVVVFLANTLSVDGTSQAHPVYLMVHSSETGECPAGQSVIYASTLQTSSGDTLLQAAVSAFIESSGDQNTRVLYRLYYEQNRSTSVPKSQGLIYDLRDPSLDLAFDDAILDEVEASWKVTRQNIGEQEPAVFLKFEERNEMNGDDDDSY